MRNHKRDSKRQRRLIAGILFLLLLFAGGLQALAAESMGTKDLVVLNDSGTGDVFDMLETNYVKIDHIGLSNAVIIQGDGIRIIQGQEGSGWKSTNQLLVYEGRVRFGSSGRTSGKDAVTTGNALPAFTLKFPEGALLADGTRADVILRVEDWHVELGNSLNGRINDRTTVQIPVFISAGTEGRSLLYAVTPPKTSFAKWDYTASNYSSGAATAMSVRTSIQIVQHTEGKDIGQPVEEATFPSMLAGFYDFDVPDHTIRSGASYETRFNGPYAEGVTLIDGWKSPVALAPRNGGEIQEQCLVDAQIRGNDLRIKGDGNQLRKLYQKTGNMNDTNSYYSGMIASVKPQGFTFCWTGSVAGGRTFNGCMGTLLAGQPTVAVKAKRSVGGSLDGSGLDRWNSMTYLMNSSAEYSYQPAEGYTVRSLRVDGAEQTLTQEERQNGGSYVFDRLNRYPLPRRIIRNGQILQASESGFYTIEAVFRREPEYVLRKTADQTQIPLRGEDRIRYTIRVSQIRPDAGSGACIVTDDLAQGLLKPDPDSFRITAVNGSFEILQEAGDGLRVRFETPDGGGGGSGEQMLEITYEATVDWDLYEGGRIINRAAAGGSEESAELEALSELRLTKEVKGSLRDPSKRFEFTVELNGLAPETFYPIAPAGGGELLRMTTGARETGGFRSDAGGTAILVIGMRGGRSFVFTGLPNGCCYRITEGPSDHRAAFEIHSGGEEPGILRSAGSNSAAWQSLTTGEEVIRPQDSMVTVKFINTREMRPVTGISADPGWLRAGLAVTLMAGFAGLQALLRRRSKGSERQDPDGR